MFKERAGGPGGHVSMAAAKRIDAAAEAHSAANVEVLTGLEPVRKRPGMYIGDTSDGSGLHNMVYELVDNAIEEVLAGHADLVSVTLNPGGSVTVEDNGRGIPTEMHPQEGVSTAEVIMTRLHFSRPPGQNSYKLSGGMHGVGVCVVNALSAKLELTIWRGGKEHCMAFADGVPEARLKVVGAAPGRTGTRVTFAPCAAFFSGTAFDYQTLERRLRGLAFLNAGVHIVLPDPRSATPVMSGFKYEGGLKDFVKYLDRACTPLFAEPVFVKKEHDGVSVEAAFWWNGGNRENVLCFTNTVPQPDGGAHMTGFRTALARTVNAYAASSGIAGQDMVRHTGEDVRKGLTGVLSVKVPNPKFAGATKDKLASPEVRRAVQGVMTDALGTWLKEHPQEARRVLQKIAEARERD
jgi:DNA gyrase subunit B